MQAEIFLRRLSSIAFTSSEIEVLKTIMVVANAYGKLVYID